MQATEAGTPQGGIISPTLANVTLNGLERELVAHLGAKFGIAKAKKLKVNVVRYADDFVITGDSKEILENEVRPWVEFPEVLGGTLLKPSRKNVQTFYRKVADTISGHKTVKQEDLIQLLNPMLRGWAQYHHHVSAKRAFSRMEFLIFKRLWRWSKRRHPRKTIDWVKKKYFHTIDGRHWVFGVPRIVEDGSKVIEELYSLSHKDTRGLQSL